MRKSRFTEEQIVGVLKEQAPTMDVYDYLFAELIAGSVARGEFLRSVRAAAPAAAGQRLLGVFLPQLGWEASQVALLLERGQDERANVQTLLAITSGPRIVSCDVRQMTPTLRPRLGDRLKAGGIHVHRQFEVKRSNLGEFVALSGEAWPDFESRFDAEVFGLFEIASEPRTPPSSVSKLLLITRYGSHGVWEASRDPSTAAMRTFARRAALTLRTRAASTLLAPLSSV